MLAGQSAGNASYETLLQPLNRDDLRTQTPSLEARIHDLLQDPFGI